ncbi:MAG: hypothetical protein ACYTFO_11900, partial [Planctomycetota bacterium]
MRFVVTDEASFRMHPPLELVWRDDSLSVFQNNKALPRAFYVPVARVEPDAEHLLASLASPRHQPRQIVLIACGVAAAARPATRPLRQWAPMLAAPTAAIVAFLL